MGFPLAMVEWAKFLGSSLGVSGGQLAQAVSMAVDTKGGLRCREFGALNWARVELAEEVGFAAGLPSIGGECPLANATIACCAVVVADERGSQAKGRPPYPAAGGPRIPPGHYPPPACVASGFRIALPGTSRRRDRAKKLQ
jgi:hypothetical protein